MTRMGAQLDVNVELINTFRSQKETVRQVSFVSTLLYVCTGIVQFDAYTSVSRRKRLEHYRIYATPRLSRCNLRQSD